MCHKVQFCTSDEVAVLFHFIILFEMLKSSETRAVIQRYETRPRLSKTASTKRNCDHNLTLSVFLVVIFWSNSFTKCNLCTSNNV